MNNLFGGYSGRSTQDQIRAIQRDNCKKLSDLLDAMYEAMKPSEAERAIQRDNLNKLYNLLRVRR